MQTSNGFRSIRNKLVYFRDQYNKYGLLLSPYIVFHEFFYKRYFRFKKITFPDFSNNLHITTSKSLHSDAHENKESSCFSIKKAFNKIPISAENIRLLDIGCGSGKSMLMGMLLNFNEVFGIDLDMPSLEQGRKNCEQLKINGYKTTYTFIQQDAADFSNIPSGINVIYLFNPFGKKTMLQVVNNITEFIKKQQNDVFVIYMNPLYIELFTEKKCFEKYYSSNFRGGKQKEMIILKSAGN